MYESAAAGEALICGEVARYFVASRNGVYGVGVCYGGEAEVSPMFTESAERAAACAEALRRGLVTPKVLLEVLDDNYDELCA